VDEDRLGKEEKEEIGEGRGVESVEGVSEGRS